jgi:hypothetical protein
VVTAAAPPTPCLLPTLTDQAKRLTFYKTRINVSTAARGGFLVFQEVRADDLEHVLNLLDEARFEIFELKYMYRAHWTVVAYQTQTDPSA